jgi:DUF4097 and DUF4098 domain-containing protein YvlB
MNSAHRITIMAAAAFALGSAWTAPSQASQRAVDQHVAADPQGQVEIVTVSGRISVVGWDKPEVDVTGTLGPNVDRVDVASSGSHTTVRVVLNDSRKGHWGLDLRDPGDANLTVSVPKASSLAASLVGADISVRDLQGDQELQSVSGEVRTVAMRAVRVHTVGGDVHVSAGPDSSLLEIGTVSGDMDVNGGRGELTVSTVSGAAKLSLGLLTHASLKSVSGDFKVETGLAPSGVLEAQSVSGDVAVNFNNGVPPAEFDLQSFSGDLRTCFGQKPEREHYGPGSRLWYRQGAGSARVHIDTHSGDVTLCTTNAGS